MKKKLFCFLLALCFVVLAQTQGPVADKPERGDWDLKPQKLWELSGEALPFAEPSLVRVSAGGEVFVWDRKSFKFFVFDAQGKLLRSFGKKGEGPGELRMGVNFFLVGDALVVHDIDRVVFFKPGGEHQKTELLPGRGFTPIAAIDADRFILASAGGPASAGGNEGVILYNFPKKQQIELPLPAAPSGGEINVVSDGGRSVMVMRIGGLTPEWIAASGQGRIVYAKNSDYALHLCALDGKRLGGFGLDRAPAKLDEAGKAEVVARLRGRPRIAISRDSGGASGAVGGPSQDQMDAMLLKNMPDAETHFSRILIDSRGLIWVFVSDIRNPRRQKIDIFSPQGQYLHRAVFFLPEGCSMRGGGLRVQGDAVVVAYEDEEGEYRLAKYKVALPPA